MDDCKKKWRDLFRQFLFVTNRISTDTDGYGAIYAINWLSMEQMTFLFPYMEKYKRYIRSRFLFKFLFHSFAQRFTLFFQRYEQPPKIEQPIEEIVVKHEKESEDEIYTIRAAKKQLQEILSTRKQPETAKKSLENLLAYKARTKCFCKIIQMIEIKTEDWTDGERNGLIQWYHSQLIRIINQYVCQSR